CVGMAWNTGAPLVCTRSEPGRSISKYGDCGVDTRLDDRGVRSWHRSVDAVVDSHFAHTRTGVATGDIVGDHSDSADAGNGVSGDRVKVITVSYCAWGPTPTR